MNVAEDIAGQVANGDSRVAGVMLESHLKAGKQTHTPGCELVYGQSITDACLGWEDTEVVLTRLAEAVRQRRQHS